MAKVVGIAEEYETPFSGSDDPIAEPSRVGLRVTFDLDEDGDRIHSTVFRFADVAGLEAEFDGNTGTTTLDAEVVSYLAGLTEPDPLPSTYRAYMLTVKSWPAP